MTAHTAPSPKTAETRQDVLNLLTDCLADGFISSAVRLNIRRAIHAIRTSTTVIWIDCDYALPVVRDTVLLKSKNGDVYFGWLTWQNEFHDTCTGERIDDDIIQWTTKEGYADDLQQPE